MKSAKAVADDEKLVRVLETAGEAPALSSSADDAEPQSNVDLALAPADHIASVLAFGGEHYAHRSSGRKRARRHTSRFASLRAQT